MALFILIPPYIYCPPYLRLCACYECSVLINRSAIMPCVCVERHTRSQRTQRRTHTRRFTPLTHIIIIVFYFDYECRAEMGIGLLCFGTVPPRFPTMAVLSAGRSLETLSSAPKTALSVWYACACECELTCVDSSKSRWLSISMLCALCVWADNLHAKRSSYIYTHYKRVRVVIRRSLGGDIESFIPPHWDKRYCDARQ